MVDVLTRHFKIFLFMPSTAAAQLIKISRSMGYKTASNNETSTLLGAFCYPDLLITNA